MSSDAQRPSAAGYWIGGLVGVVGLALGVVLITLSVSGIAMQLKRLERIPVPGQRVLTLAAGKHAVYVESSEDKPAAGAVRVKVRETSTGRPLALARYGSSFTYTSGHRSGLAAYTFVAARRGRYRIAASGPAVRDLNVVVGPPLGRSLFRTITGALGGFGLLFLGPLAGGVIALITAGRRRRFDHEAAMAASGAPTSAPDAAATPLPPGGWYPDPSGQARLRWWDGQRWTEHTS
ncbi:MAG: DUF2510 domain-containing protein [Solirubrobacteraceae bacterium]